MPAPDSPIEGSIIFNINGNDLELKGKLTKSTIANAKREIAVGYSSSIEESFNLGSFNQLAANLPATLATFGVDTTDLNTQNVIDVINEIPVLEAIGNAEIHITDLIIDTRGGVNRFLFGFGVVFTTGASIAGGAIKLKALGVRVTGTTNPIDDARLADLKALGVII
jgi:hypothetical protein